MASNITIASIFDVYERRDDININIACAEYIQEVEPFFDNIKLRDDVYPDEKTEILEAFRNYEGIYENFKLDEHLTLPNIEASESNGREEKDEMLVNDAASYVKNDDVGTMMMNSNDPINNNNNNRTEVVSNDVVNSAEKNNGKPGKRKIESNDNKEGRNNVERESKRRAR